MKEFELLKYHLLKRKHLPLKYSKCVIPCFLRTKSTWHCRPFRFGEMNLTFRDRLVCTPNHFNFFLFLLWQRLCVRILEFLFDKIKVFYAYLLIFWYICIDWILGLDDILILCLLFSQNSFYQNCFIQIFFYSNISVEYKMDDKLGFDIDNIMKKIQFAGTRRTQVVHCCVSHTFYGLVWYVGQIQKLYRIIQPLTKYAFLVIKVLVSTSSPSNISTWILTPCQTNFNPFLFLRF